MQSLPQRSLWDRFTPTAFRPRTTSDLFALRLAQKLDDAPAAGHYVTVVDGHSESQVLCAYRRALRLTENGDRGRRFHLELERIQPNGNQEPRVSLISIRVERRAVAATIFRGEHLEYADARQLSSARDKALSSAVGFINWMLSRFSVESAALESILNGHEIQRRAIHDSICTELRERMLPIWEVPKFALLEGCGYPALKSRLQLREIATSIWPIVGGTHAKVFIQDSAMLGIHVQTERLFMIN